MRVATLTCLSAMLAMQAGAQTATKKSPALKTVAAAPAPSTLDGVFTADQAARGRDVYLGSCKSCHAPASHTGAMFKRFWVGKPLSNLFMFVSERVPKNDPGSLAPDDVADVVSYLLQWNAMPPGTRELPADLDSLKKLRIDLKKKTR
jgi:S-disulfanyl-L-cysteine oxidoreductase SoxD